jgi:hypothetical protein
MISETATIKGCRVGMTFGDAARSVDMRLAHGLQRSSGRPEGELHFDVENVAATKDRIASTASRSANRSDGLPEINISAHFVQT